MSSSYFNPLFIQQIIQDYMPENNVVVSSVRLMDVDNSASILAVLSAARTENLVGHFGMEITYTINGNEQTRQMVMKIKPHGSEISEMLNSLAQACGGELASVYEAYKSVTGFQQTHLKEQEIYSKLRPSFTPEIFGLYTNNKEKIYIILMEYLQDVELLNSAMDPHHWSDAHIKATLTQMAQWHSSMLGKTSSLDMSLWNDMPSLEYMSKLTPVWKALLENAGEKFPELYHTSRVDAMRTAIDSIPERWKQLQVLSKTLVHNDCNPRNSCFKIIEGKPQLCLYDWELATFHIPQYDVAELLCFVLDTDRYALRSYYLEFYRTQLHVLTGKYGDAELFEKEFQLAALDFGIHRLGMYMMAHAVSPYPFISRVVDSFFDTIKA